uniref:CHAT domain-containing protein n=1 Tax=Clytia hemisphaerica TaxID=252671 RepID=A0A7M5WRT4_9CNID
MGRHAEALAAYASALAHDEKSQQLLQALMEASLKSNLQETLEPLFEQLEASDISGKAFATVAIIGQELLASDELQPAITVLESSLQLGTDDLSLKGSVYSALSSAYWKNGNVKRALHFMHQDLLTVESLDDNSGVCRVHGNLGNAYFCQNLLSDAQQHHQMQLDIATQQDDTRQAANALTALGHVFVASGDYENALSHHKRSAVLRQEIGDLLHEAKELANVGAVYALLGDFDNAIKCQEEHLKIVMDLEEHFEICHAMSLLGGLYQRIQKYEQSAKIYQEMFRISQESNDYENQCNALSGLGMAYRLQGKLKMAENCHEQQLKIAIEIQNRSLEAKAQADLGLTYQEKKDFAKALEYQKSYLESCRTIDDREGESRAYGNIGDAYQALEQHERAIKYYKLGLSVAKDVDDHHLEGSLHGKIAASYQALEMVDNALKHHKEYLSIAVELKDLRAECTAECNLGNFYSQQERFEEAVSHYENGSAVANKLQDKAEMCKATHNLAYAYYRLKNYNESIEFYEENISLANDLDDRELLSMAYCNLGLAYLAMNDFEKAVRCQKLFLASAREKKNTVNVCKALGNLGKIYIEMGDVEEGLRFFYEKVKAAEKSKDLALQADCNHELAKVLENEGNIEEAEARFEKELTLRRQIDDKPQQFYQAIYAYASLLEKSEKLEEAHKLYCEVFQHAKQLGNLEQCKTVCQLMGRINMRMEKYDKAIIAFRLQLECISDTVNDSIDSGHVHLDISECYKMVGNHDNAIHHLLQYQQIATVLQLTDEENIAYKKLSDIHIYQGTYQEALMYSEKRLICCQELEKSEICDAYKNVAFVHALLQNYDSAISYYEKLLASARDLKLTHYEYHAYRGLGDSYKLIKEYEKSMHAHQNALDKAVEMENKALQADSYNLLGDAYNKLDNQSNAIQCYKQSLTLSEEIEALDIQMQACGRLGKLYYQCGQNDEALDCFRSAVKYSDELGSQSEQIKALYRLAFGLYLNNDLKMSLLCFQRVVDLVEYVEHKSITSFSTEAIKFIMAAYQMLQKVYVKTGQYKQALFMAEKANSLNLELLLKKAGIDIQVRIPLYEKFLQRLKSLASNVCFYSTVLGQLYCWILSPKDGFVKFWQRTVIENYEDENLRTLDMDDVVNISLDETNKKIDSFIETTRKTLDVEIHEKGLSDRTRSFAANIEVIDRKQNRRSRIGRPVVSNSFDGPNAPAYQFRYRRPNKPDQEKRHSRNYNWFTEAPIEDMYKLFVEEIDDYFNQMKEEGHFKMNNIDLKIIVPRELALIPFPLLRGQSFTKSFSEQYNLSYSPNLFWFLETKSEISSENIEIDPESENVFIFGGGSELVADEARGVAKVFGTAPTTGNSNLKEDIVDRLNKSIVCHLSSDVAWQTPSFVFPCKVITKDAVRSRNFSADPDIEDLEPDSRAGSPGLSDVFITAKDIYEMNLKTSLVMYGISSPSEYTDPICADGLYLLMISLQMAGCKTLITSTWPVADNARRRFFQGFYQQYNKGIPAYEAFQQTVHAMQTSDEFKHPTHWAGFVLYGQNSMLNRQTQSLTKALHEFLDNPNRDAIKVILHLVEKARQRLASDRRTSLYVAESSINKKIAPGTHWKPILAALGFRFEKAQNNLPDAVFFPGMECTDTLNNSSNTLYAFLGLSRNGLEAIAKLRSSPYIGLPLIKMLQEVLYYFNQDMSNVQVPFPLPLWRVPGCHEFLSSVGFELMGIGKTEVMLRSGKITMRRPLQCALQASKDLFGKEKQISLLMINSDHVQTFCFVSETSVNVKI